MKGKQRIILYRYDILYCYIDFELGGYSVDESYVGRYVDGQSRVNNNLATPSRLLYFSSLSL